MNRQTLFFVALAVIVLGILLGVYYLIPGVYHPMLNPQYSISPLFPHRKYAVVGFGIAVIGIIAAFVLRPQKKSVA